MAWSQYQAGTSYPIFQRPDTNLDYIDGQICNAIQKYLTEIHSRINLMPAYIQQPLCTHDIAIMDDEKSLSRFTLTQQKQINCVHLYLGVTFLRKICTVNGCSLVVGINNGNENNLLYKNLLE